MVNDTNAGFSSSFSSLFVISGKSLIGGRPVSGVSPFVSFALLLFKGSFGTAKRELLLLFSLTELFELENENVMVL